MNKDTVIIILALCIVAPILILMVVATIIALVKRGKYLKKPKNNSFDVNQEYLEIKNCFGNDNIISIKNEMSRITVSVKDLEQVNAERLKELGAKGVLFVGNDVKCSFENANEIYNAIKVD